MIVPIDRARPLGAIVIGRAGMDLYPDPDGTKIETATRFVSDVGGSAANIAVALARQGARAALLSAFSADPVGRFVKRVLADHGVDISHCRMIARDARTSLALAETRSEDCEVVIYRNGAADFQIAPSDIDPALFQKASVLVVTGTGLAAEPSRSAIFAALDTARDVGTFTLLDIDHRPYSWKSSDEAGRHYQDAAAMVDAVVGNEEEFALLDSGDAILTAEALVDRGRAFAIVKRGDRGSITVSRNGQFSSAIFPIMALKPFGAGDAFAAGVIAALLEESDLEGAVAWGSAAAAIVVSRRGCASAMPDRDEIKALIASHKRQIRDDNAPAAV